MNSGKQWKHEINIFLLNQDLRNRRVMHVQITCPLGYLHHRYLLNSHGQYLHIMITFCIMNHFPVVCSLLPHAVVMGSILSVTLCNKVSLTNKFDESKYKILNTENCDLKQSLGVRYMRMLAFMHVWLHS